MHGHTHHHPNPLDSRYREVRKVTLIGSVVDLLLGIVKVVIGVLAHSQALVADGIHSFSDLFTDFLVLFAAKHAHREADEEHPYGHGRIETVATVALGGALLTVAVVILTIGCGDNPGEEPELVALVYRGAQINLRAYRFEDDNGVARLRMGPLDTVGMSGFDITVRVLLGGAVQVRAGSTYVHVPMWHDDIVERVVGEQWDGPVSGDGFNAALARANRRRQEGSSVAASTRSRSAASGLSSGRRRARARRGRALDGRYRTQGRHRRLCSRWPCHHL